MTSRARSRPARGKGADEIEAGASPPLGMPPGRFLRDYWQKRPLLVRQAFPAFTPTLSPDELAGLACMQGALARLVEHTPLSSRPGHDRVAVPGTAKEDSDRHRNDGKWAVRTGPFDDDTFATLPERNWTLLVQDVDKWDARTAALLDCFAFIPRWRIDDVMISYAVDGGGVGAHVDRYDVFLLQGFGQRRWAIDTRENPPLAFRDGVELKLLRAFHPTHAWTLEPGDMLYLPPGVPHDGVAIGECTTFSVGMRAPATGELMFDLAAHIADTLPESRRYEDPDLQAATAMGEIDRAALGRIRHTVGALTEALDDDALADWFGRFITRYRAAGAAVPRKRSVGAAIVNQRLPDVDVERNPWSRIAWRRKGRNARLYVAGDALDAPLPWARALAATGRTLHGSRLARLPQRARGCEVLAHLVDAGHVWLRRRREGR